MQVVHAYIVDDYMPIFNPHYKLHVYMHVECNLEAVV